MYPRKLTAFVLYYVRIVEADVHARKVKIGSTKQQISVKRK